MQIQLRVAESRSLGNAILVTGHARRSRNALYQCRWHKSASDSDDLPGIRLSKKILSRNGAYSVSHTASDRCSSRSAEDRAIGMSNEIDNHVQRFIFAAVGRTYRTKCSMRVGDER